MGALSSWASLALSHHVLVQIAVRRVGWKYFDLYAIFYFFQKKKMGDDIVIADKAVAFFFNYGIYDLTSQIRNS